MTDIVKFDMQSVAEKLRAKVQSALVDLVPDEQWDAMVKQEAKRFLEGEWTPPKGQWDQGVSTPAGWKSIVWKALYDDISKRANDFIKSPEWTNYWEDTYTGETIVGESLKAALEIHGATILQNWMANAMATAIRNMAPPSPPQRY